MNQKPKTEQRQRVEQKVKLGELTENLHDDLLVVTPASEIAQGKRNFQKPLAWLVLLGIFALAVLPAIGTGWTVFYLTLSLYLWQGFIGLAVVVGALSSLAALYVIIFK